MPGLKMNCPQCGAQIPEIEESGFLVCEYCDSTIYVDLSRAILHFYFPVAVGQNVLTDILTRWLSNHELKQPPQISGIELKYFPFWRITKGGLALFRPAASFPIQEVGELKFPGGDFRVYQKNLAKEYEVVAPDIYLDGVLDLHREELDKHEGSQAISLIHVPLYLVRYKYGNDEFEAAIEGVLGRVLADEIPAAPQLKMDSYFAAAMIGSIAVFTAEFYFIPGFLKPLLIAALTAVPLHFIFNFLLFKRDF
jgi:hypothetical protein